MINLAEGRFEMRRDGSNSEHTFCYDSLPNGKVAVDRISTPELQPKFPESQTTKQPDGKEYTARAETAHAFICVQQQSRGNSLNICDDPTL